MGTKKKGLDQQNSVFLLLFFFFISGGDFNYYIVFIPNMTQHDMYLGYVSLGVSGKSCSL